MEKDLDKVLEDSLVKVVGREVELVDRQNVFVRAVDMKSLTKEEFPVLRIPVQNVELEWLEKGECMKIAIATDGHQLGSKASPLFGRCPFFILLRIEDGEIIDQDSFENTAMDQPSGAGTAAAQLVGDKNIDALITGAVGPKAFSALKKWEIDVYRAEPGSVQQNIDKFLTNELEKIESPTGPSGMGRGEWDE